MDKLKNFFKTHQQAIVLAIGYVLVASLGFGLGQFYSKQQEAPEIKVEQAFTAPSNYNASVSATQTAPAITGNQNCQGKIKGSKSMIYHLPGGAFYDKTTNPIRCFDTEAEAKSAGFRKSSR